MHYKRKKPRTHSHSEGAFPDGTPGYWNILYHSCPRRRREAKALWRVRQGEDPDTIIWDLGNNKPHEYYW